MKRGSIPCPGDWSVGVGVGAIMSVPVDARWVSFVFSGAMHPEAKVRFLHAPLKVEAGKTVGNPEVVSGSVQPT